MAFTNKNIKASRTMREVQKAQELKEKKEKTTTTTQRQTTPQSAAQKKVNAAMSRTMREAQREREERQSRVTERQATLNSAVEKLQQSIRPTTQTNRNATQPTPSATQTNRNSVTLPKAPNADAQKQQDARARIFSQVKSPEWITNLATDPYRVAESTAVAKIERDIKVLEEEIAKQEAIVNGIPSDKTIAAYEAQRDAYINADWYEEQNQDAEYQALLNEASADEARLAQLKSTKASLEDEIDATKASFAMYRLESEVTGRPDFEELSKYESTRYGDAVYGVGMTGVGPGATTIPIVTDTGYGDVVYDAINNDTTAREIFFLQEGVDQNFVGTADTHIYYMEPEEIAIYNALHKLDVERGTNQANEYLDLIKTQLTARQRKADEKSAAAYATEHPFVASIGSVLTSPLKVISFAGQTVDYLHDGKIDQNAGYNKFVYESNATRETIRNMIEQSLGDKWGPVGSFGYDIGMSMGDFLMSTAVSGGNKGLALAIMGTSAAADTVLDAKDRGLSDDQAIVLGVVAGAAEIVTEKWSLDALFDADWTTDGVLKYLINNGMVEMFEEGTSNIIYTVADVFVSQTKSEWNLAIEYYKSEGMTHAQACNQAFIDQAQKLGLDMLAGGISGITMAGGRVAVNQSGAYILGSRINSAEDARPQVERLIEQARFTKDPTAMNLAQEAQGQLDEKGKVSNTTLGNLSNATNEAMQQAGQVGTVEGETLGGKASEAAERIAAKVNNGEEVTQEDIDILVKANETADDGETRVTESFDITSDGEMIPTNTPATAARNVSASAVETLTDSAKETNMGENGVKAIAEFYDENESPDVAAYYGAFTAYWQGGFEGKDISEVKTNRGTKISDIVKRAAYNAGQLDAIKQESSSIAKTEERVYNNAGKTNKTQTAKTIHTKKGDWSAHDVEWHTPRQKSPIAYSTVATSNGIEVLADENPTATISELRGMMRYDRDAQRVLDQYINAGYGDQIASEWFSYDRKRGYVKDGATTKEGVNNGETTLGEVPDVTRENDADTLREDVSGLLDGVASENVQEDERTGDTSSDAAIGGRTTVGTGDRSGTRGVSDRRGAGSNQGADLRTAARGVSDYEQRQEAENQRDAGSNARTRTETEDRPRVSEGVGQNQGEVQDTLHLSSDTRRGQVKEKIISDAAECGLECAFIPEDKWPEEHAGHEAYIGDKIYIKEEFSEENAARFIPHEAAHAMRRSGFGPYLAFVESTFDKINSGSSAGKGLLQHAAEHRKIDLFSMSEHDMLILSDEIAAMVSAEAISGLDADILEHLKAAFHDYDAYKAELLQIHQQFKDRKSVQGNVDAAAAEIEQKTELASQEAPRGSNLVIGEKGQKMPTTPKARFKANSDAIKTLRTIMAEGRLATPEEQIILSKYTGWGGLPDVFDERKADWEKEYKQLKELLDDAEYKTAKGSILDAYYTDPAIIRGMYNGLAKLGFTGGRMLEPSAGVGRFIGAMPQEMLGGVKSWTAVELDKITGNIAKYLYPNADVRVQGYESTKIPDGYMDVVIGNVPFGNIPIADKAYPASVTKSIHNYFIAKSLDKVRPGGILAVITSSGTMDADGDAARAYFMKQADLIGAIRLPNTAFQGTGTSVVSDILVFKKREPGTAYKGEAFLNSERHYLNNGSWNTGDPYAAENEYFTNHPEMVLGKAVSTSSRYGSGVTYNPLETKLSLQKQIEKAFGKIKAKMEYPVQQTQEEIREEIKENAGKVKQGGIVKKDGKLLVNDNGMLREATEVSEADADRMGGILEIRDAARTLLDFQLDDAGDHAIAIARKKLNDLYDKFVKKHGILNSQKNKKLAQLDVDAPFVMALENYDKDSGKTTKADIFTKNTVSPIRTITHADTVEDALIVSMNETGTVDVKRIAELTGQNAETVERDMLERGLAFRNRDGDFETAEVYLSGNVRAKLKDAEALAEGDPEYQRNVDALKKVIPDEIPADEIKVRLGATWVPDSVYSAFAGEMLGGAGVTWARGARVPSIEVKYNRPVGKFFIEVNDPYLKNRPENTSEWGTYEVPFIGGRISILDAALNNKTITVWRSVGDARVVDKQATAAAQEKLEKVLAEFQQWMWKDETRRTELGAMYNEIFNNTVTPKYDGSNLTVNGSNPSMEMRPHQKNAVQRIINSGGNTLLAHRVGAGKTYEMAAAAMKLRQLGIVKKPLFAVPKHLVAQWGKEFISYFPAAKILVLGEKDFTPANRKTFANRIATGDYDAVIMSYEQFGMVPMSVDNQEAFYQEQLDALEMAILESRRASGKRDPSVRDMERSKKTFEAKIKKLADSKKDAENIDFEQLGVDALFVDEAHNFKNLFYTTKMQGVADLGDKDGSQRAFDLFMKTRYLQRLNGGRGIVFATATPVMNSVVELYTMQRYLQGDLLDAKGLTSFDAWANQFGDVVTIRKMKTGGNGYELKQSLSKYKNLAEMQQMFRSFADVITDAADLPYLKIPTMKGGKRIVVECDPSEFQEAFMEELGKRAEALRGAGKGGDEDHIFKVFDDGKKISYTQRMIDSSLEYEDGGKILRCVENVLRIWTDSKETKGTQLIFCDRGTPGGAEAGRGVSLYDDIKNMLVGAGVPANEIAFIHDATNDDAKAKLFKDVNEGKVRVLIGSTSKMGTGMNVQKRIVALHELNAPDRPGDLEQNEGRALRQGNMNDEVEVYAYVTKKTFDSRQWDNLKRKATFIHQIMAGEYNGREADGDGDLALSAAEISAIASDNPLIMEQFEISEKIANLENLERAHTKAIAEAKQRIVKTEQEIASDTEYLKRYKADLAIRQDTTGDKFKIVVDGKTYTERKAAGEALIAAAQQHMNLELLSERNVEVGTFAGFKLIVTSKGDMLLRGNAQYRATINMQNASGTIQTLEAIPKRLEVTIERTEKRLSENRAAIAKLEKTISSPFARAEELIAARVRENEIFAELNPQSERDIATDGDDIDDGDYVQQSKDASGLQEHPERWEAERVGGADKAPMSLSEIIAKIRHDFGINVTTGHVRGKGVRGQYDLKNKGIRTRIAQDLPTVAHELGHALDDRYSITNGLPEELEAELISGLDEDLKAGYKEDQWVSEGYAEYVRKFLQNRETAAIDYPEFTKHFLNSLSSKDAAMLENLADEINAYYSLDADSATSSIRFREEGGVDFRTIGEKIKAKANAFYQAWVDSSHGIKEFDKATGASTYKLASNSAYADAIAGQIIIGDLTDANGQYVATGLKTALHGLNLTDKHEYRMFGEYLTVKHGPERLAEGQRIFADDRKNSAAFMERRQAELEDQFPHFAEIADRLYAFEENFLETWGVGTGLVSQESADTWRDRWSFYVPLNRAISVDKRGIGAKRGFANQNSTIKKARGSGLDIVHPVDNIINNIVKMVNAGVRNNVMVAITSAAKNNDANALFLEKVPVPMVKRGFDISGVKTDLIGLFEGSDMDKTGKTEASKLVLSLDDILYQYGKGKAHGDVITVLRDGKQEFWKINDAMLLSSITNMDQKNMEGILDTYAVVSRFMTANITGNNIVWSLFSNFPRDLQSFFVYSKSRNPVKAFSAMGSAYVNKVKGDNADPLYKEYLAMGGGQTSAYTSDRDLAKRAREKLKGKNVSANPVDWLSFVSNIVESGPRFATYKLMRQAGLNQQEAFYEAMDITVNFRRGGTLARQVNKVVPFFNASVQGLDKFRRWITASDVHTSDRKKVAGCRMVSYLAVSAALAALMYALNNRDDESEEEYQQLSNYTKNSYWCIPLGEGRFFTIPKPRELGVLSSFFETSMEYGIGENDHAFDGFYDYATNNCLPTLVADVAQGDMYGAIGTLGIVGTGAYMMANRDFLGRPIVSGSLQNLEPKDQYTERTSKIAYWVGQAFNWSPEQVDYFFNSTLGGWHKAQKALFPVGGENVDLTLGVQNTYVKDNQYSQDLTNWLYDKADKSEKTHNSDPNNMDKAIDAAMDGKMTSFYSRYNKLSKNMPETTSTRATRQTVLNMILEYQKASDNGYITKAQSIVYSICKKEGSTELLPSAVNTYVKDGDNKTRNLSAAQYVEYQTDYNRRYWEYVEDNITTSQSHAEKLAVLKAAKQTAEDAAKDQVLARIGAPKTKFSTKFNGVPYDDIVSFRAELDLADDDGGVNQDEVKEIVLDMIRDGLSKEDAYTLFHSKYKSDKNNPWRRYK